MMAAAEGRVFSAEPGGIVMTVQGPMPADRMGITLTHEHVLVDFIGADQVSPDRYDAEEAFQIILPYLNQIKELGCQTFVECTPAYIGRDPKLLKRLSEESGLHILTNTGYYGAANDKYVPKHAYQESAEQLAGRWIKERQEGIEGAGIRPGFIKTGVDAGALSPIDGKLIRAAALAHKETGLTIASHTGDTQAGEQSLKVLQEEGIPWSSFIWVHAQNGWQAESRINAARDGAWISIDNIGPGNVDDCAKKVLAMRQAGLLDHVLLSHDAGWYSPGEAKGGSFRAFDTLFTVFLPHLKSLGYTQEEINQLIVLNPRNAFTVRGQSGIRATFK